ncbi:probable LRR receptor-like serine/threonine-protein kinase At3g47570 isoform X1 [Malus sylvestris]|uniref:probable LRR receptor-like serine/threonine-protein kinase At3g47570 isoform X1 n=1 Tax=Malus sylvestris TaxID=3752 RepID=UPI0021ACCE33|nr:probable LRR receptor-like serine/threonine-protein kinase At3g47570 isoform X1 [Malus sylvestris]
MGIDKFFPSLSVLAFFSLLCMHAFVLNSCLGFSFGAENNETDSLALLEIKARITEDPFAVMSSWNETIHFCQWRGVTCSNRHRRATGLNLESLKLAGSIPPHVGNLSFLRVINLQNNSFGQEIPTEIGRLRRLQVLRLNNNSLGGDIPSNLSACSQLLEIDLGHNLLVGGIPEELGTLSKLRVLVLRYNKLRGSVPYSFSNLSSLEVLSASSNTLSGSITDIFGQVTKLTEIGLADNSLSGMIPPSIFNLPSLIRFSIQLNEIEGTFPSNLGIFSPRLQYFDISYNQFSGSIPVSLSNASNLGHLSMLGNNLHGNVPSLESLHRLERFVLTANDLGSGGTNDLSFICDLSNATKLKRLNLNMNNFGGILPQCIANLSASLQVFYASDNKLVGSIPNGIGNLVNLESLYLSMNQFSGEIPSDLGKLQNLYLLDLAINSLSGEIPSSFGNLSRLTKLYFDQNKLQGNLPLSLAECHNLQVLFVTNNNLSGNISPRVIGLSSSYISLDLSQNRFTSPFPQEVGKLINLEYLDVSENMFSGQIPSGLGSCIKLEYIYLQGNLFQETIPLSLASLRGVRELNLSHNNLSGKIPKFLESFVLLQSLNLSYNMLEGMVPIEGVFKNATATSVKGNRELCGGVLEFQLPKCKREQLKKVGLSLTLKLIISIVSALLGVTFAFAFMYHCCVHRERKDRTSSDKENFLRVSYQSLLKATNGFSSSNLIGAGSFGSVYKGVLDEGETTVAVKVLNLVNPGASKSFIAECEALRNIRHRNLVKVLSACSSIDYNGNDFKALVYEFMVNGTLDDWLHLAPTVGETNERPRTLNFSQRLNISIDIAMALDYLHHQCETPIVHCDLKPSNVLLNDDMIGHVGDFGLVRFLLKSQDSCSANQSSTCGVKGTIGYTPPEYGMGNEVWTQGDVYSYGILLLELFTGKRPTDEMFQGSVNLHKFVKAALPNKMEHVADPVIVQEKGEGDMCNDDSLNEDTRACINIRDSLISVLEVGVACSAELPRERLNISDALAKMCQIRNKLQARK